MKSETIHNKLISRNMKKSIRKTQSHIQDKHITENFSKGVERLVDPIDVGTIHFIQSFNRYMPRSVQKKMVESSGSKTPYMGFVVEPYSYFLAYELKDLDKARDLLPDGFELVKSKVFTSDEPRYYAIFGCFNAHTSGFWGMRTEFYLVAEDTNTGLMSWIIVDYDTNTITYEPKDGFCDPNARNAMLTVDFDGMLYVDVRNDEGRQLIFSSDTKKGVMAPLDERLWIEGNLSIAYGGKTIDDDPGLFGLKFDVREFEQALMMPADSLKIEMNNWYQDLIADQPSQIACFPYAQHYLSDSPGHNSEIHDERELKDAVAAVDFGKIDVFSTKPIKTSFLVGGVVSAVVNLTLLGLVLFG